MDDSNITFSCCILSLITESILLFIHECVYMHVYECIKLGGGNWLRMILFLPAVLIIVRVHITFGKKLSFFFYQIGFDKIASILSASFL